MNRWILNLGTFALLAATLVPSAALAVDEVNVSTGATSTGPGLAVHGYDVVAYFTQGRPTIGSYKHAVAHEGATYRFASQANLDAFKANPEKYAPAFGGFCAFGTSVGKKFDGDPLRWRIVDGRLFLNLNADIQRTWLEDVAGNIAKADENWRRIEHSAASDL